MQSKLKKGDRVKVVRGGEPFVDKNILYKEGYVVGRVGRDNFVVVELDDGFSFATKSGYVERIEIENIGDEK